MRQEAMQSVRQMACIIPDKKTVHLGPNNGGDVHITWLVLHPQERHRQRGELHRSAQLSHELD